MIYGIKNTILQRMINRLKVRIQIRKCQYHDLQMNKNIKFNSNIPLRVPHSTKEQPLIRQYLMSPGNLLFLGTNVITLAGILCLEKLWLNKMKNGESEKSLDLLEDEIKEEEHHKPVVLEDSKLMGPKHMILNNSLDHLFYTYGLYQEACLRRNNQDGKEVSTDVQTFYNEWYREFSHDLANSPETMNQARHALPRIITLNDVSQLYDKYVDSRDYQELIRYWLYDYCKYLKITKHVQRNPIGEKFYRRMIQDCSHTTNHRQFNKYILIMMNPNDRLRQNVFFNDNNKSLKVFTKTLSFNTVSLDTYCFVLKQLSSETPSKKRDLKIGYLIRLLRNNCIQMKKQSESQSQSQFQSQVRILLPPPAYSFGSRALQKELSRGNKDSLRALQADEQLLRLLQSLSSRPASPSVAPEIAPEMASEMTPEIVSAPRVKDPATSVDLDHVAVVSNVGG
ncbi:hypothetical protein TBLA_0F00250 [Henningerozyma blattae CBS 6284]|uniref:Uncharacterized protein n=1 Tax=Henningerozyma blattae (strain ATCC 34711 / CBS 6284 / DSM 70876 / NBRC 10599 / NRRL Y-10934 / UCD 77-7) TaxID=1071380 RepID=I2H5B7_HENB6|nr:hypothetical protein TBLA_0F00250 [Tetrapisispora blattae CBS 6284]CCH61569.1 hypothetical protein TBLA_0F00250 [Tetrapisispora blattae CBS 6284]